jgi:CubicO group peptidase (beta-lactamase class C family)
MKTFVHMLMVLLLVALVPGGDSSTDAADPQEVEAFFDAVIPRQMEDRHVVGATVAVVKDGRVVLAKGYGYADLEQRTPVVADRTLFYIGSAGKLFTWTAVMQLAEQGKLNLHADVSTYLDFTIPATHPEPITMEHLLTHTPGFEEQLTALLAEPDGVLPLRDFLVRSMPRRVYPPGKYFAYSNYGSALAGYIVERVSGEPFEQYLTDHILQPLEMGHSAAVQPLPASLSGDMSKGYRYGSGGYDARDVEWVSAAPAAPIRATATDLAKFMIAHLQDGGYPGARILQEATARDMHAQHFTHDPRLPGLAYGFVISRENEQYIIWHDGESARFTTILALLPEQQAGLLVSYNTPGQDPRATLTAFLDRYYPPAEALRLQPLNGASTQPSGLVGTYVPMRAAYSGPQKLITWSTALQVSDGRDDTLHVGDQRYLEIEPGLFRQIDGDRRLTFGRDAQGRVTHLFWGPLAYFKVPWYQAPSLSLLALAACLLVFLSALLGWSVDAVLRWRRRDRPSPGGARLARLLAGVLGLLSLLLVAWFAVLMLRYADTYVYPSAALTLLTHVLWLVAVLAPSVVMLGILAWKRRYWNLPWRLHYSVVAFGSVAFVTWLISWDLLRLGP